MVGGSQSCLHSLKRTTVVQVGFVVPSDSPGWPPELHGMELGKEATRYRKQFLDQSMPVGHILTIRGSVA
jgi:hypothetical protein